MTEIPPELAAFAPILNAQPEPVRQIFYYCLCLMMVETDNMHLVRIIPGDGGPMCLFELASGTSFVVPQPQWDAAEEAAVVEALREILAGEGLL